MFLLTKCLKNEHLLKLLWGVFVCSFIFSCTTKKEFRQISLKNPGTNDHTGIVAEINNEPFIRQLITDMEDQLIITADGKELAWELIDKNSDGNYDALLIQSDFVSGEEKTVLIKKNLAEPQKISKKTQAEISIKEGGEWVEVTKPWGKEQFEYQGGTFKNISLLKVPERHTDHSLYIRYEGPGWESDKIGYRFYLDWRNAVDIFGKKTEDMVLQDVGQDGFESYHENTEWGMDILKVGESLGIGSLGYWADDQAKRVAETDSIDCTITTNGNLLSVITTNYYGWNTGNKICNLNSELSITAGSRLTKHTVNIDTEPDNLCTGIVKHENTELLTNKAGEWGYLATFGKQSLADDNLGMVIFFKTGNLTEITEDENSHVVVLKPDNKTLSYYFGATWEQDLDNISSKDEFREYLNVQLDLLNHPVEVILE